MRDSTASELEKAKQLSNMVVNLTLLPLMAAGAPKFGTVNLVATQLLLQLKCPSTSNSLLVSTVEEILQVCKFLEALTSESCAEVPIQVLDDVMRSNAGARLLVRQNTQQCPAYQKKEMLMRSTHVAVQTMGPKLRELSRIMCETPSYSVAGQILTELPRWRDGLPPGSTASNWQLKGA